MIDALQICVARTSHFCTQSVIACAATDWSVVFRKNHVSGDTRIVYASGFL